MNLDVWQFVRGIGEREIEEDLQGAMWLSSYLVGVMQKDPFAAVPFLLLLDEMARSCCRSWNFMRDLAPVNC